MPKKQNHFQSSFDFGNTAFAKDCHEPFELIRNGIVGTYEADSIDDLSAASALVPGGRVSDITHTLFISNDVVAASLLVEGSVLVVRGHKVRVKTIHNEGDNSHQIDCTGVIGV